MFLHWCTVTIPCFRSHKTFSVTCHVLSEYPGSAFFHPLVDPSLIPDTGPSQLESAAFKLPLELSNISLAGLKRK
jgi:hypothetical protein